MLIGYTLLCYRLYAATDLGFTVMETLGLQKPHLMLLVGQSVADELMVAILLI